MLTVSGVYEIANALLDASVYIDGWEARMGRDVEVTLYVTREEMDSVGKTVHDALEKGTSYESADTLNLFVKGINIKLKVRDS